MSGDLVAFLRARLDEDEHYLRVMIEAGERYAALATPKDTADAYSMAMAIADDPQVRALVEKALSGTFQPPNDLHQVLRSVEADRKLLAEYEAATAAYRRALDAHARELKDRSATLAKLDIAAAVMQAWQQAVRLKAAVFRDHPSYRQEWVP